MASTKTARYKPHPMLGMEEKQKERLAKATGKPFDSWVRLAKAKGLKTKKDLAAWLVSAHGHAPMNSYWIAQHAFSEEADYGDPETLVDALYGGERAALRPLHESVVDVLIGLGDDVTVTACKTMVPAYRKHVFAELSPTTDGVMVELALGDEPAKGRLEPARRRMPGDRLTHGVLVRSKKDVDAALEAWLRRAYDLGAGKIARSTSFETPPELAKALAKSKPAAATWSSMTPAMQRDMAQWIGSAKQDDTKARRLSISLAALDSGKKRVY